MSTRAFGRLRRRIQLGARRRAGTHGGLKRSRRRNHAAWRRRLHAMSRDQPIPAILAEPQLFGVIASAAVTPHDNRGPCWTFRVKTFARLPAVQGIADREIQLDRNEMRQAEAEVAIGAPLAGAIGPAPEQ